MKTPQPVTVGIREAGQLQRVRGGEVSIGGRDGQDEAGIAGNELHDHVLDLLADIRGLVAHRYLGQTRQIDQGYVQN
jgi:hypothetical protein